MKILLSKTSKLLKDNSSCEILEDSREMLRGSGFSDEYVEQILDQAVSILDDYAGLLGEGTEIDYSIERLFFRIELRLFIKGRSFNPFQSGSDASRRSFDSILNLNLNTEAPRISYDYILGRNMITVSIPLTGRTRKFFRDPMVLAVVMGIAFGLLIKTLPQEANSFIVDDLATPVMTIILKMVSGIMGPVIFISMTTSIIALDSINDLTNLGFKIIRRFLHTTIFLMAVSIAVSELFFRSIGSGQVSVVPQKLIGMVLDVIPTNIIQPFIDNNTPQLVVLGFLFGAALLVLGDRVTELNQVLMQIDEWFMSAMRIILMAMPVIPFISIMTTIAKGSGSDILQGWKFIAATYIVFTIVTAFKFFKTSKVTGTGIGDIFRKIKPVVTMSLTTGSTAAPMKKAYEISEEEFNIKPGFSSFWIPMCSAMLSPGTTVYLVIATFMMAQITGMAVTNSFLMVVILVTLELSMASPGTSSAWTIMFETLAMPTSYVGLFTAYRLLTNNYVSGCSEAYYMLEEVEAAHKLGGIGKDVEDTNDIKEKKHHDEHTGRGNNLRDHTSSGKGPQA